MYKNKYVSVLIAAAGVGSRMGGNLSKQFINLGNKPVLAHTIEKFEANDYIDEIIIIMKEDDIEYCKNQIVRKYKFRKVSKVIRGGRERQDSVYNGILALNSKTDIVLSHDGARPFVSHRMIEEAIEKTYDQGAAVVGMPVTDTVKIISESGEIETTPKRSLLWAAQTPQAFRKDILVRAYNRAIEDYFLGTDDSSLVERIGIAVSMVEGSYSNIKLTTPEDIKIAESIIERENIRDAYGNRIIVQSR